MTELPKHGVLTELTEMLLDQKLFWSYQVTPKPTRDLDQSDWFDQKTGFPETHFLRIGELVELTPLRATGGTAALDWTAAEHVTSQTESEHE